MDDINLLYIAILRLGGLLGLSACAFAMVPGVYLKEQVPEALEATRGFWFMYEGEGKECGFHGNCSRTYRPALQPKIRSPPARLIN
jgi:hypothetical protein